MPFIKQYVGGDGAVSSEEAGTIWLVSNRTYRLQEDALSSCSVP